MKNLVDEIKMQFGNATSLYRIMSINVGVFLLFTNGENSVSYVGVKEIAANMLGVTVVIKGRWVERFGVFSLSECFF